MWAIDNLLLLPLFRALIKCLLFAVLSVRHCCFTLFTRQNKFKIKDIHCIHKSHSYPIKEPALADNWRGRQRFDHIHLQPTEPVSIVRPYPQPLLNWPCLRLDASAIGHVCKRDGLQIGMSRFTEMSRTAVQWLTVRCTE